jgi:bifunctional DNA-binding transcriptional regulator/antitoxin component of YhaV-PrlF toxin-antitoxin module
MRVRVKSYRLGRRDVGTYFLTLPAEWVEDNRLEKGQKLDIFRESEDGSLVIVPRRNDEQSGNQPA